MFPKMVRDKIVQEIVDSGRECVITTCSSREQFHVWAARKFTEELGEFIAEPSAEEAADFYEVFLGLLNRHGISEETVKQVAASKRERLGGFRNGTVLHKVTNAN